MPLYRGRSNRTVSKNISELHKGRTYAHTRRKFSKRRADRQAVAIAMRQAGRSRMGYA